MRFVVDEPAAAGYNQDTGEHLPAVRLFCLAAFLLGKIVGAVCSAVMYFVMNRHGNLLQEYSKMNWAPIFLGISVVGLEVGFIYAYKIGWAVSTASIVQNAFLAVALLFVGALLYHEAINASKIIGVVFCLVGLFFLNR